MDPDILRDAHPHVREEHEKLRGVLGVEERALQLAVAALVEAGPVGLPGITPELDAPLIDWIDYFLGQAGLELRAGQLAQAAQESLFEAAA